MSRGVRAAPIPKPEKPPASAAPTPETPAPHSSHRRRPKGRREPSDDAIHWLLGGADAVPGGGPPIQRKPIDTGYGDIVAAARAGRGTSVRSSATVPSPAALPRDEGQASIHDLAQVGTSGPGTPLPHLETIQKSFGPHDVAGISAHTDARAASAARAMRAAAFTTGDHVAFAGPPTVHTAAHEAAHVIQQRAGVQLQGGVGQAGDAHERHADAVADRVVAGESSVALLDQYSRPGTQRAPGARIQAECDCPDPERCACGKKTAPASGSTVQLAPAENPGQSTLAEIHDLLSTGVTDWRVSGSEAHRALMLLRGLDPVTRLDVVMKMRLTGDWNTLRKHLPESDLDLLIDLEQSIDPHLGPLTRGDMVEIVFSALDKGPAPPYSLTVEPQGLRLPSLPAPVPVIGLSCKEAAGKIAAAYADYAVSSFTGLSLRIVSRGLAYSGRTMGTALTEHATIEARTPASKQHRRRAEFLKYLADAMRTSKIPYEVVDAYQSEVEARLDQHASPSDLLAWALSHRQPPSTAALPHQRWFDFLNGQQALANQATGKDKARLQDTLGRFLQFLDNHLKLGDLDKHDPAAAWARATVETMAAEHKKFVADAVAAAAEHAEDERSARALKLYTDVLDLMLNKLLKPSVPYPRYVEARSEGVGYLYQSSPAERRLRREITDEILADVKAKMNDASLGQVTAAEFVSDWFERHPLRREALYYASSYPAVEKFAVEREIPGWQIAIEVAVGFIPIVGQIVGVYEVVSGEDLFGNELSTADRAILGVAILLPAAGRAFKLGKGVLTARSLVSEYRLAGAEADAVYRAFVPIAPGSRGAKLLGDLADDLRGRRAVSDARRAEAAKLLDEMGMMDRKTADALRGSAVGTAEAEQRVASAIERDIKALGPMTGETEALLRNNAPMRQALAESSLAARALKKCASPCFPEGLTADQIRRLEAHLEKMSTTGPYDEAALREYLHRNRTTIDDAIAWVTNASNSAELDARVKLKLGGGTVKELDAVRAEARKGESRPAAAIEKSGGLGPIIDSGGFGEVHSVPGHPDLVIKVPKGDPSGPINAQLAKEAEALQGLRDAGVPTAYRGTVTWRDPAGLEHTGILMERIEGGFSKKVLQQGKFKGFSVPPEHRALVNERTVSDLKALRNDCLAKNIDIEDLQFMIAQDGSIRVIDPARVRFLESEGLRPRKIREQMKLFEKRINDIIKKVGEIANENAQQP